MPLLMNAISSSRRFNPIPTGIISDVGTSITKSNTSASGTKLADLTLVGGNATGTWSILAGSWINVTLVPTIGRTVRLQTSGSIVGQTGAKSVTVQYDADDLLTPLEIAFTITVTGTAPTGPTTVDDFFIFFLNGDARNLNVLSNDANTAVPSTVAITTAPPTGHTASVNPDGSIRFKPKPDFSGEVHFAYTVKNSSDITSRVTDVEISVLIPNTTGFGLMGVSPEGSNVNGAGDDVRTGGRGYLNWASQINGNKMPPVIGTWPGRDKPSNLNNGFRVHNGKNLYGWIANDGLLPSISLPLGFQKTESGTSLTSGNVGTQFHEIWLKIESEGASSVYPSGDPRALNYYSLYRTFFDRLKDSGIDELILRIAWEMTDGLSFPHTISRDFYGQGHPDNFVHWKRAWRAVVTLAKSFWPNVGGQPKVWIDWCNFHEPKVVYNGRTYWPGPDEYYPGDAYVDIIGVDFYDAEVKLTPANWKHRFTRNWKLNSNTKPSDPMPVPGGPTAWFNYAVSKGKPFATPESGLRNTGAGSDNPLFIELWHKHINQEQVTFNGQTSQGWRGNFKYGYYFNRGDSVLNPASVNGYASAHAKWRQTFGG